MSENRLLIAAVGIIGVVVVLAGLFFFRQAKDDAISQIVGPYSTSAELGIDYLEITPALAKYYGLGVEYGALVTEVIAGSAASSAGVHEGDVILSYNNTPVRENTTLLGIMMACQAGNRVRLEIWSKTETRIVEIFHGAGY